MAYLTFSWWDYVLFAILIIVSIAIGIYYGFRKETNANIEENAFLVKDVRVFPVAVSFIASTISVMDLLSVPAEIYNHGTQFWIEIFTIPIAALIIYFFFMPSIQKLNFGNGYRYLERRYNGTVSKLCLGVYLLPLVVFLPVFIYGASLAFNQATGFNIYITAAIFTSVCTFYTTLGGLRAVIWTDTLQFIIAFLSLITILILGIISIDGGFNTIWKTGNQGKRIEFFVLDPNPTIRTTFWNVLIGHTFRWMSYMVVQPSAMQRLLSVSEHKQSKSIMILFVIGMMVFKSILCFTGLVIYSKYYDCDPLTNGDIKKLDQIVPYFVLDAGKSIPLIGTVFIASVITTASSVLSTILNTITTVFCNEYIYPLLSKDVKRKWTKVIFRFCSVSFAALLFALIFLASRIESIFEISYISISICCGPLLGVYTMAVLFSFTNIKGVLSGLIATFILMIFYCIKSSSYLWNGTVKIETKPISIQGCNGTSLLSNATESIGTASEEEMYWIFRISFHYYILMGCLLCLMIGLPISWFCREKGSFVDPDLICPIIYRSSYKPVTVTNGTKQQTDF